MDPSTIGVIGVAFLLAFIAIGVPIAFSMAVVGIVGTSIIVGFPQTVVQIGLNSWAVASDFVLVALPMFILMGQLVFHFRIAEDLYETVHKWLGRLPGGLAITAVVSSAGFGAVTGVSAASVATMGAMTMPEMRLFIAGIVPGILLSLSFVLLIYIRCVINPKLGPVGPSYSWTERFRSLNKLLPVLAIFIIVIGGIYLGIVTPTEASAIGVLGVLLVGLLMRRITWPALRDSLIDTGITSSMIFMIIIGGHIISRFLVLTDVTSGIVDSISGSGLDRYTILFLFVLMYLVLGAILDIWGMIILTMPFVFPAVMALDYDPVWFGIFVVLMTEMAMVTPPIGINVYVMHGIAPEVKLTDIFRGVMPFVALVLVFVALLAAFPEIALWLPSVAFDR